MVTYSPAWTSAERVRLSSISAAAGDVWVTLETSTGESCSLLYFYR